MKEKGGAWGDHSHPHTQALLENALINKYQQLINNCDKILQNDPKILVKNIFFAPKKF